MVRSLSGQWREGGWNVPGGASPRQPLCTAQEEARCRHLGKDILEERKDEFKNPEMGAAWRQVGLGGDPVAEGQGEEVMVEGQIGRALLESSSHSVSMRHV